jgi:SAM-dependent methyltransferase
LPVFSFGALTLARVWPIHQVRVAVVTVIAVGLFWFAYLYVLDNWPARWAAGTHALLASFQGIVGIIQFLKQGSVGLSWMGEEWLDPMGQGVSVIEGMGRRWMRAYGMTAHPNFLGGYLSMSLLICLGALLEGRLQALSQCNTFGVQRRAAETGRAVRPDAASSGSGRLQAFSQCSTFGVAIALGGLCLVFTFSRSAWLGTLVGLAYMAWVVRPWRGVDWRAPRVRRAVVAGSAVLALALLVLLGAYGDLLITRLFRPGNPLEQTSIQERIDDVAQAWSLIRAVPFKGTGPGYYLGALWARVGEDRPPGFRLIHNIPLLVTAELGVGGLALWLWLILAPPIVLARRSPVDPKGFPKPLGSAGVAAAFASAAVTCMLDNYLYIPSKLWPALYLGVLAGMWAQSIGGGEGGKGKREKGEATISAAAGCTGKGEKGGESAYAEVREGFDRLAGRYDREVEQNQAMGAMRGVSLATLLATFQPGQRVIEVGCGTGEEAVALARGGVHVLATDLSPEMVCLAAAKAAAAGLEGRVQTCQLAAGELGALVAAYGPGAFDGAYSSFGPLNGEPDLRAVADALAVLVRPGGSLVVSVMNRFYVLETLWYLAHGHPRQAVRRWSGQAMAGVSPALSETVPTWYHTPWFFRRHFPQFRPTHCRALSLLLPPPYLAHLWPRWPRPLHGWEEALARRWPFYGLGDHFLMVLKREQDKEGLDKRVPS